MTAGSAIDSRIKLFLSELARWAPRANLVGSAEPEALRVHVDDALAAAPYLRAGDRVADLGSGAGFPGLPLAIARPDVHLTLVEVREKRVAFLRHVVRTLALRCTVRRARIEEGPEEPFDLALLRAVAAPERSLELARPWVRSGGEVWIWAGPSVRMAGTELAGRIPLDPRGAVLRFPVARVSRGTL